MRIFYTLTLTLMLPLILARLLWRSLKQRGYRENIGERFGRYQPLPDDRPAIWIHAVSVGETRAAQPLERRLLSLLPRNPLRKPNN